MTKKRNPNALEITTYNDVDTEEKIIARTVLDPTVQAGLTIKEYGKGKFIDPGLTELIAELSAQTKTIAGGDLGRAEAMLTTQAHTLDAIVNNLARRAINAEYMDHLDRFLKLALRAQSQCRATWETLSAIKNPPVAGYVKQANIAHGPQQVNNGPPTKAEPSRTGENQKSRTQLLEKTDGNRLDTRATGSAIEVDQGMEAVEAVDRATNIGG